MGTEILNVRRRFNESNILFQSESTEAIEAAIQSVQHHRRELKQYVFTRPHFRYTLRPIRVEPDAPLIVRLMADSTRSLSIGPMAAVAGALADLAVQSMLKFDVEVAIVEDGGEVSAQSRQVFNVGLYAGKTDLAGKIGFQIKPSECPIGIGTSSATVSHAFSFGEADAATVFTDTAASADAAATAVCNAVRGRNIEASVQKGLSVADKIGGVRGALIVRGDCVGVVGKIPKLFRVDNKLGEEVYLDAFTPRRIRLP